MELRCYIMSRRLQFRTKRVPRGAWTRIQYSLTPCCHTNKVHSTNVRPSPPDSQHQNFPACYLHVYDVDVAEVLREILVPRRPSRPLLALRGQFLMQAQGGRVCEPPTTRLVPQPQHKTPAYCNDLLFMWRKPKVCWYREVWYVSQVDSFPGTTFSDTRIFWFTIFKFHFKNVKLHFYTVKPANMASGHHIQANFVRKPAQTDTQMAKILWQVEI